MKKHLLDEIFPVPTFSKPRQIRQTWLKDPGFSQARWGEKMGLIELPDFLEVMAPRLDYVKLFPDHAINAPQEWFMRKLSTYIEYSVIPYFDHAYFQQAYRRGKTEQAIVAAAELGIQAMEFMNVNPPISAQRWTQLVKLGAANNVRVIFEFHPPQMYDRNQPEGPTSSEDILSAAMPCLDAGATALMIDHKEFDLHGERAEEELGKLIDQLSFSRLIFEVDSPAWHQYLRHYFRFFGSDANVSNILPGQAPEVEKLRQSM
ncbi:phosphosulfolactate synthase [Candidatus Poribacteria bacterium]